MQAAMMIRLPSIEVQYKGSQRSSKMWRRPLLAFSSLEEKDLLGKGLSFLI